MNLEDRPSDYDFALPPERIAQHPSPERDAARLLVVERNGDGRHDARVRDLPSWLEPGDLLVVNVSRVVRARLRGRKASGGRAELLVLGPAARPAGAVRALLRCRGRQHVGLKLKLGNEIDAEVVAVEPGGVVTLAVDPEVALDALGEAPLPPYIRRPAPDPLDLERYQTVYARVPGSIAAPTAGLHLDHRTLAALRERGLEIAEVVLHVGLGTFQTPGPEQLARGALHPERFVLPEATARAIERTRARGGRVVAVGTTTTRVLETCADASGGVRPAEGETTLFVRAGFRFRVVDALLTNFHLPGSSLLMLVAAFAGRRRILEAYAYAVREDYRFYSYGDAMLIR